MTESVATSFSPATSQAGAGGDRMQPPAVEGRVGKANRRRSRASRKTPTTVLNTDTTNFRAMVQQYTGGPSTSPFQAAAYPLMADGVGGSGPGATLSFGLAAGSTAQQLHHQPTAFPAALGVHQQYQQYYTQFHPHHEGPLFMPAGGTGSGDVYFPRFGSSNPQRGITDAPDGFLMERISSSQMMPRPAASTGDTASDGFLF
ncbi:hypothetical protein Taro_043644 [Colocasia esculenta]|uniref:VQ domain-containing protein n=1 Tax=Colocasia esculenta TaxID=4460 RepID=A0A843WZA0_COLES|nr:hypothetical protein [Colocasia esculenta]